MFIRDVKESRIRLFRPLLVKGAAQTAERVRRFRLRKDQAMHLVLNSATEIKCVKGMLWLTVDGDFNDYVLSADQSAVVWDLRPLHVVVGFSDSEFFLTDLPDLFFIREPWTRRTNRRFRSWFEHFLSRTAANDSNS